MKDAHVWIGAATVGANALAAVVGLVAWLLWSNPRSFWLLLRTGQALVIVSCVVGAVLLLEGRDLPRLHLVYALTPIAVSFLAEQLRIVTTPTFLEQRGLEDGKAVARLPEIEQQALVTAILRRELAVMATSAFVVATLVARAQLWF
jgi:hypothetical protein